MVFASKISLMFWLTSGIDSTLGVISSSTVISRKRRDCESRFLRTLRGLLQFHPSLPSRPRITGDHSVFRGRQNRFEELNGANQEEQGFRKAGQ